MFKLTHMSKLTSHNSYTSENKLMDCKDVHVMYFYPLKKIIVDENTSLSIQGKGIHKQFMLTTNSHVNGIN